MAAVRWPRGVSQSGHGPPIGSTKAVRPIIVIIIIIAHFEHF